MARTVRYFLALLGGGIAAYILATIANSQFVMNAHQVPVSAGDRINMTLFDVSNMLLYLVIILGAFLIAFLIAAFIRKRFPRTAAIAFPIAGAVAIGAALGAMYLVFQTVPISGARSAAGFASQMVAGAFGGWVFAKIAPRTAASK